MIQSNDQNVEDQLRSELTEGDAVIGTLGPILRHLLASDDNTLFSDEIIARVRGMLGDVARQLLHAQANAAEASDISGYIAERREELVESLFGQQAFLNHAHSLALEWQLTERIHARIGVDPVLSPLLQALIASSEVGMANAAMMTLATQARFAQSQRRMELPLGELPGDLFHASLISLRTRAGEDEDEVAAKAEATLRSQFDESATRLGLISRLVTGMGGGAIAALSVDHAGVAIFLSALSIGSGQDRDLTILSTNNRQLARLALALRASGLKPKAIEEQFAYLHPDISLPQGFEQLRADRAAALLATSSPFAVG